MLTSLLDYFNDIGIIKLRTVLCTVLSICISKTEIYREPLRESKK